MNDPLIQNHGGFRNLKSFQMAQLVYDMTVLFCDRYISKYSRTTDQMVQAARSGVQNIAEGSQASGTSKKTELKLTNVARASLEELKLDYEDFLRQRGMIPLPHDHHVMLRFKARRCASLNEVRAWVQSERARTNTDEHGQARTNTDTDPAIIINPLSSAELAANAALSLLNLACYLLDKQLAAQAKTFETEGGFTERLYRKRIENRNNSSK